MKLFQFILPDTPPEVLFAPLSDVPYSLFFDSADREHRDSMVSYIMCFPLEMIESKNGKVTVTNNDSQNTHYDCPFETVKERLVHYALRRDHYTAQDGFWGGAAGYWGYDLARGIEILPGHTTGNPGTPDMAVGIYDQFCRFDHRSGTAEYFVYDTDFDSAGMKFQHFLNVTKNAQTPNVKNGAVTWDSSHTEESYKAAVQNVIDAITAGDIFQANISQRFEAALPPGFDRYAHYLKLRAVNAAPFAVFMNLGGVQIASASPERFLSVHDFDVETRPIKGTVRRDQNPDIDLQNRRHLTESEKERAENIMIVDLLRNDLSRSCEDHSVTVPQLCALESFAQVHHLVSTVTGRLRANKHPLDLLKNAFPGGSITGAPKVQAMTMIENIETHRRGAYCGSIGYCGYDSKMDTNIVIRTLVYQGNNVSFNTGGGITAASDPTQEYEETIAKAAAIFESFEPAEDTETKENAS